MTEPKSPLASARAALRHFAMMDQEVLAAEMAKDEAILRSVVRLSGRTMQSSTTTEEPVGCCMIEVGGPLKECVHNMTRHNCLDYYPDADWVEGECPPGVCLQEATPGTQPTQKA